VRFSVAAGGVTQADISTGVSIATGGIVRLAVSWKENSFRIAMNGMEYTGDTSGSIPTGLTQMEFARELTTNYLNSHIRQAIYYPQSQSQAAINSLSVL
jgi:hypothetical protein